MLKLHFLVYHEKMEKPVILRNYFFLLYIFATFATNSEGTWTLSSISFIVVFQYVMTWKKNLILSLSSFKKLSVKDRLATFSMSTSW